MTELSEEQFLDFLDNHTYHGKLLNFGQCKQVIDQLKQLISQPERQTDEDMVNRYKILFHDASSSVIEQLIRKLMREIQSKETQVDEKYIEEKARELFSKTCQYMRKEEEAYFEKHFKDFIRSIVSEIQKPKEGK